MKLAMRRDVHDIVGPVGEIILDRVGHKGVIHIHICREP